jgi:hypothetical protein
MSMLNQLSLIFGVLLFGIVAGYIAGRVDLIICKLAQSPGSSGGFNFNRKTDSNGKVKTEVAIDDSKFVTAIDTAGFSKTSETALGKVTEKSDDIQASVSRLAQLKGKA